MRNPDKYIRKYFFDTLNGMVVNGKTIPVYDTNTPNDEKFLVILSTQSGSDNRVSKCSLDIDREILIDVVTRFTGRVGSREMADDIVEKILELTQKITIENFTLQYYNKSFPSDLTLNQSTETIHRKFINYQIKLKENG